MRISKIVAKTVARLIFYFALILLLALLLLQIRPVQTYMTQQVLALISERTDHEITIDAVKLTWVDRAELTNFLILDTKSDTLIFSENITFNYRLKDIIGQDLLSVEGISTNHVKMQLIKHDSISPLNFKEFLNSLQGTEKKEGKPLRVGEINCHNLEFSINDKTKEAIEDRLDLSHMEVTFSDFLVSNLEVTNDTVDLDIIQIRGKEPDGGLEIVDFSSHLSLSNQSMSLTDLWLETPTSTVSDSVKLYYNGLDDLAHFVDSVSFGLYLSKTKISQEDLQLFIGNHGIKSAISFDGTIWGTVGDFNMEQSRIGFGRESFIEGGISCFGLPNLKGTFALADITNSHLASTDVEPYLGELSKNIAQLGRVDFTGSFAGFLNDFVARGDFITERGSVHSDINIKIPSDTRLMSYSGNLELKNMDVGAFLRNDLVQRVNLKGRINGTGITAQSAHFDLNAVAFNTGFKGYEYDSIKADGTFASNFFKGKIAINDPNCKIEGDAELDFNQEKEVLKVSLDIENSHLKNLNFVEENLVAGGKIQVDIVDLDLNGFTGIAKLDSSFVEINDSKVLVDSIKFLASLENGKRQFKLSLPGVNARVEGRFKITDVLKDLTSMSSGYLSKLQLLSDSLKNERSGESYEVELFAQIDNLSRYLDSLRIPIEIPDGSFIEGTFRESKSANISIYAQADYIKVGRHILHNPVIEANGSKNLGSAGILTNFIFESDRQEFSGVPETRNLLVEGVWYDDRIDLTTSIRQEKTKSNVRLMTVANLTRDSIVFKFSPSNVVVLGDRWTFDPSNQIIVYPGSVTVRNLKVSDIKESIELSGSYSVNEETQLNLAVNSFELNKVNLFSEVNVEGTLDGDFNLFKGSADPSYKFDGGFLASDFLLNDFLVGNIEGNSQWHPEDENIYTQIEVDRENFKSINLRGYYYPLRANDQLDFNMTFSQADLRLAQPFLEQHVSGLKGYANGNLEITGSTATPRVVGECNVSDGAVRVNYLHTDYTFSGSAKFRPNLILLDDFDLQDRKREHAKITGSISHDFFKGFHTDIHMQAQNFEFLNTTSVDNSLYYGSANGSGTIDISGPLNDLLIKAAVKTDKGTRFFIPITEGGDISQQGYITFIDFSDTTKTEAKNDYNFQGLTLDFDIDVTQDAYCELIFDIKTGDIIRGRGDGNLKLTLNTDGEFSMFGPLQIAEGAYNFTVPGFINKEFQVSPGSRITWFGDPYNATIDLDALYFQRASLEELKSQEEQLEDQLNDKIGINVVLNLDGGMASPTIDFDLAIADKIDETERRKSELAQVVNDEQELRRQVISLLFFKRFSPISSFTLGGGGNVGNSVSEFFSSQVSYLVSQLDENLEVEVDLASLDREAFNTFQLRLAYTFLDGRLKLTRGGGFANESDNSNLFNDIIGDWSVEYSLTKDGRLRAKAFSATNQRLTAVQGEQNQEKGVSLRFVHSFNDLRELLSIKREEAIRRREEEVELRESTSEGALDTIYK